MPLPNVPGLNPNNVPVHPPISGPIAGGFHPPTVALAGPAAGYFAEGQAEGAILDGLFTAANGVTFSSHPLNQATPTGHVYAGSISGGTSAPQHPTAVMTAKAPSTLVTNFPAFNEVEDGVVRATFSQPRSQVTVTVTAVPNLGNELNSAGRPYLYAYDAHGTLLGQAIYPVPFTDPAFTAWHNLTVTAQGIAYVEVSCTSPQHQPIWTLFGRLVFS